MSVAERGSECGWRSAAIVALLLTATVTADELTPEQVVSISASTIAEAIAKRHRELETDTAKLHALIDELLRPKFDLEGASRLILREHWTQATPAQRQRFVAGLYHYLVASYGTAVLEFRYDTVTVLPSGEPADESTARVKTVMRLTDSSTYHIDYYMRHSSAGWRILDVIAEGVSYVRTYRTDFGAEVRANGLDALIKRLETTTAQKSTSRE